MTSIRPVVVGWLLAGAAAWACPAAAHPVAQGALTVVVAADRVSVRAAVSTEEVLVAAVSGGRAHAPLLEIERGHGEYLLAHFRVAADGRPLRGRVVRVPEEPTDRPVYELEYGVPAGAPTRLSLEQDVLREFDFVPGNPWEATYVVRLERPEGVLREGLLLTSRAPLVLEVRHAPSGLDVLRVAREHLGHGVMHILTGWDHLLFVVALVLAVTTVRDLVLVVTAFTLAHSVTLTLAVLDVVRLPSSVVEPVIALSIVVVAGQNVIVPRRAQGTGRLLVLRLRTLSRTGLRGRPARRHGGSGRWSRRRRHRRLQRRRRDRAPARGPPPLRRPHRAVESAEGACGAEPRPRAAVWLGGNLCGRRLLSDRSAPMTRREVRAWH